VYLTREAFLAHNQNLLALWRQRALGTGMWMGFLSFAGLCLVWMVSPHLTAGMLTRGWPLVAVSAACGIGSLVETYRLNCTRAVIAAAGAVGGVISGWGISQYPEIIPPLITSQLAQAPDQVLWMMLIVIGIGALLLFPALAYLMYVFKSDSQ
jgi:cytochrome bd ubiquinol oxidase subunit II